MIEFEMRMVRVFKYGNADWSGATFVTVRANTEAEAKQKAEAALEPNPVDYFWAFRVYAFREVNGE